MISRYNVSDVAFLWSDEFKFKTYLEVELALLKTLEKHGKVPKNTASAFAEVKINPERIIEIEQAVQHDLIAFCTSITEQVPDSASRWFHFGVTSSDIIDTSLSIQFRKNIELVIPALNELLQELETKTRATKDLLCLGRSHGMTAEAMIMGQKFLSHYSELKRRLEDYQQALPSLTGQYSGAVGSYTVLTPAIEKEALALLGLEPESVSSQVIPRDRYAKFIQIGAMTAAALERLAVEIRHLHHSDVGEVHEGFSKNQKGSSTMPHKKNPISSENITGLSRIIRSHAQVALENIVLWHERDISHSSAERLMLPDHFGLLVYGIRRMRSTIRDLVIHKERIEHKVFSSPTTLSSLILHHLIEKNEVTREKLYAVVQSASFEDPSRFLDIAMKKAQESGLKFNPALFQWSGVKDHYVKRFQEVMERNLG